MQLRHQRTCWLGDVPHHLLDACMALQVVDRALCFVLSSLRLNKSVFAPGHILLTQPESCEGQMNNG